MHTNKQTSPLEPANILLALGSNCLYSRTIPLARDQLEQSFTNVRFTRCIVSEDVKNSDAPQYANCLCKAQTDLDKKVLIRLLKMIEGVCGNNPALREQGQVLMDIDLLMYNGEKYHLKDWERPYIKTLLSEL